MDDLRKVLKVENNSGLPYSINSIFNGLSDVPELYPFDNGVLGQSHYFLRFSSPVFAEYALTHWLYHKDVRVLAVRQDPRLIAQYEVALGSAFTEPIVGKPNSNIVNARLPNKPEWSPEVAERKFDSGSPGGRDDFMTMTSSSTKVGKYTSGSVTDTPIVRLASTSSLPPTKEPDLHVNCAASLLTATMTSKSNPQGRGTGSRSYLLLSPSESAYVGHTLPLSFETRISMVLCGEVITYDLEGLDSDPRVIIELLKATNSERANYIVVAVFYRRSGDAHSARAVLMSMVEELSKRGVSLKELKPAFLLLSGCEVDLAKLAKTENKDASKHYAAAQEWLQEVFGKAKPQRSSEAVGYKAPVKQKTPTRPRALSRFGGASSLRGIQTEQEMQKLRERVYNQATQLFDLRASKRKLEEDYIYERDLRRRCQRQRDEMEKERDAAREIERHALEQVKREVANRRKAEERAEALSKEKDTT